MTHDNGAVRYGKRRKTAQAVKTLATSAPEQFKDLVLPFLPELVEILFEDARDRDCIGHRTAVSSILDGLKITGSTDRLLEAMLSRLSMPNEASLVAAAELYRAVQGQDIHEVYRECKRMVEFYEGPNGPGKELVG